MDEQKSVVKINCDLMLSHLGSYAIISCLVDPVVDCPSTVDYILERNLMKCQ